MPVPLHVNSNDGDPTVMQALLGGLNLPLAPHREYSIH
ncbi:hypothetical protein N184_22850 [Sinorhizobium sp. GL28]|nr:hypothetical protein N184_22850 [Sinorhizobium sp. GL28]